MLRKELKELHYIAHVSNVPSICAVGLLSHRRAKRITHESVADPEVQDRRKGKRVPGGMLLHDYANLYMTARNPMLYKLARVQELADELCVLRVSDDVLDLPGVVVSDMNAAAAYCRFYAAGKGLEHVDAGRVFRHYWTDGDAIEREQCKKAKCAEVLIPNLVEPSFLTGIYVGTDAAQSALKARVGDLEITKDTEIFFNP